MKMKAWVFGALVLGLLSISTASHAAVTATDRHARKPDACTLNAEQAAARKAALRRISERYLLASLESMEDPAQFIKVRRETRHAIWRLRAKFGSACISVMAAP